MRIIISERTSFSKIEIKIKKVSKNNYLSDNEFSILKKTLVDFLNTLQCSNGLNVFLEKKIVLQNGSCLKILAKNFSQMSIFEKFFSL